MFKWNKTRKGKDHFFKLKNGQWMKITFYYKKQCNIWFETIVVGNCKRECNDCIRKTEHSPKVLYGRPTGKNTGTEPLRLALDELLKFEKTVHNTQINIVGASDRLNKIYKYLSRYGYIQFDYIKNKKPVTMMYKKII